MKFECPHCTQHMELFVAADDDIKGARVNCPACSRSFEIPAPDTSQDWLDHITIVERTYWESKPQSDKDWWYANTRPDERGKMLQEEIAAMAKLNEIHHLPPEERDAILNQWKSEADAARDGTRKDPADEKPDSN